MKKQTLIEAIETYCSSRNTDDLVIDDIVKYLAESGTYLKWRLVNEVSILFSLRQQCGPRQLIVGNDSTIKVISDDIDDFLKEISNRSLKLVREKFPDQNVKLKMLSEQGGIEISIESLEGL